MCQLYAILDKQGELYAMAANQAEAKAQVERAEVYLDGAATCGHPAAAAWVAARLPIEAKPVTAAQGLALLQGRCVPVLEREP
jgi:hypothetical protein